MNKGGIRILSLVCLAVAATAPALAQKALAVALSDFSVNSSNPKFTYLGKGFTEIAFFELHKSSNIRLVDREQRNAALSEVEFSLSGITEEGSQLEVGKLLSVRYVVYGSIPGMGKDRAYGSYSQGWHARLP